MKNKSILIILATCLVVYFNALFGALVWEDQQVVSKNVLSTISLRSIPAAISTITYHFVGSNTFVHHLINILFHAFMCILVYWFLSIFYGELACLMGALLFAVLPIHVEPVVWIASLQHILEGVFLLSTFLLFYKRKYLFSLLVFYLACLNFTPWIALIPVFIFIFFLFRFPNQLPPTKNTYLISFRGLENVFNLAVMCLILGVVIALNNHVITTRVIQQSKAMGMDNPSLVWSFPKVLYSLSNYFMLSVFPTNLTVYHEPNTYDLSSYIAYSIGLIIMLIVLLPRLAKDITKPKPLIFGLIVFILFLSPSYSPVSIGWLVAERYAYISTIFFSIVIAWVIDKYGKKALPICLLILALYSVRTMDRISDWKTEERFWRATLLSSPYSPNARNNMGVVYAKESNILKALQEFNNALRIEPDFKMAKDNFKLVKQAVIQRVEVAY